MACWITDGSTGFTVNGNVVTHSKKDGSVYNAMWKEGDGVSAGKHYWKIHFPTLDEGAGVGLTSTVYFNDGFNCRGLFYSGNLSNCSNVLVGNFGPIPDERDSIGILAVFEADRLKVYIDVNGTSLGLAFNVPASNFESIFPAVSFHKSGSATCTKLSEIPKITDRAPKTFTGIEGDWRLKGFQENDVKIDIPFIKPTCKILMMQTDKYSWQVKVVNSFWANLFKEEIKEEKVEWKTSGVCRTMMNSSNAVIHIEDVLKKLINNINYIEVDDSGNLKIKCYKISSTWTRYDSSPGHYFGDPFESFY